MNGANGNDGESNSGVKRLTGSKKKKKPAKTLRQASVMNPMSMNSGVNREYGGY